MKLTSGYARCIVLLVLSLACAGYAGAQQSCGDSGAPAQPRCVLT